MSHEQSTSFRAVIDDALAKRKQEPNSHTLHSQFKVPLYVVGMCEAMLQLVHAGGNKVVTLRDLVVLEGTCTGADYVEKFALRSERLAAA
ncbi:hypothetical protein [Pseudomonas sp. NPDC089569]|uniref:hypothetical protein n=1 Tax=Pseudomonas sp. NPDC089569 TaxID=3390722 RepID=UPI003CFEC910